MKNNIKKIDTSEEASKKRVDAFMKKFLKERGDLMKKLAHE